MNVSKSYGHIRALTDVSFDVRAGEVVGLVGDNGAGKSTLVNIIAGAIRPSSGILRIDGQEVHFNSALDARMTGIEAVYQDLALALDLDMSRRDRQKGKVDVVGYDAEPDEVKLLKDGVISTLIIQQPAEEGRLAVQYANDILTGKASQVPQSKQLDNITATAQNANDPAVAKYFYQTQPAS